MQLSEKIVLPMIVWVLLFFVLALSSGLEVLLILILIGVLIIRELTDSFTPIRTKDRVDYFIYASLTVFAIIIIKARVGDTVVAQPLWFDASSSDRFAATSTASMRSALRPFFSSECRALMAVPPGEVTRSFSFAGCSFVS